jgi:acetoin utilization deacetylase AcuC-like enzyme
MLHLDLSGASMTRVGFSYDPIFLQHLAPTPHPESPARLTSIFSLLKAPFASRLSVEGASRQATDEELLTAHTEEYLSSLQKAFLQPQGKLDEDTFFNAASPKVARGAAGLGLDLAKRVARGELDSGFAALRPPGHHATPSQAMGFCIFNNVGVAAANLLQQGLSKKIMILDWDVHHGNGTQDIFWNHPDVLFISTHQWPLYPGTGHYKELGGDGAKGGTINIPLPPGTGDSDYLNAWDEVIEPAFRAFQPDFLLISAGYDAYEFDPLGAMKITRAGFTELAKRAAALMNGKRLVAFLEGGYNTSALGTLVSDLVQTWLGDTPHQEPLGTQQNPDARRAIQQVKELHRGYW